MNSSELRIGNMILRHTGEVEKVVGLTEIDNKILIKADPKFYMSKYITIPARSVQGVAITHEWMDRLGFTLMRYNDHWKHYQQINGFNISQWISEEAIAGFEKKGSLYWGESYLEINYVHELQNLYFIVCKKELKPRSDQRTLEGLDLPI